MTSVPFAYFGTPYVARDTLVRLIAAGYRPAVVVTSPDAPRGRGLEMTPSETRVLAESLGIPVRSPRTLDEGAIEDLRTYGCQYAVVVAYGRLLPQALIDLFPLGVLNIHYSLLPKYRGASPVEAALLNDDRETGVTVQRMVLKMDAGDILAQRTVPIQEADTVRELRARLIEEGADLLIETLPSFLSGTITPVAQDESQATYAGKIAKEDGLLSLKDEPRKNWSKYRAFLESPGTFFYAAKDGKRIRVKILEAEWKDNTFVVTNIVPESKGAQDFALLVRNGWVAE